MTRRRAGERDDSSAAGIVLGKRRVPLQTPHGVAQRSRRASTCAHQAMSFAVIRRRRVVRSHPVARRAPLHSITPWARPHGRSSRSERPSWESGLLRLATGHNRQHVSVSYISVAATRPPLSSANTTCRLIVTPYLSSLPKSERGAEQMFPGRLHTDLGHGSRIGLLDRPAQPARWRRPDRVRRITASECRDWSRASSPAARAWSISVGVRAHGKTGRRTATARRSATRR